MNTSPIRDIEGKTTISYMIMKPIENTLKRGQENGDATKVVTSAEIETMDGNVPKIDADVKSHEVSLDGYRVSDGQKIKVNINKKDREMQLARIKEQEENKKSLEEDRDI